MAGRHEAREAIAALIARDLGLAELGSLSAAEREEVDRQTDWAIEAWRDEGGETDSPLARRLRDHAAQQTLRADEADARLAAEGEVFAREDDA